jgi:hypothetical protein
MKSLNCVAVSLAAVILSQSLAFAEEVDAISPGTRVRVKAPRVNVTCPSSSPCRSSFEGALIGKVQSVDGETITLQADGSDAANASIAKIRLDDIQHLDIWRGTQTVQGSASGQGAKAGAIAGVVLGAVIGAGAGVVDKTESGSDHVVETVAITGALGGLVGSMLGGLVGLGSKGEAHEQDVWEPVSTRRHTVRLAIGPAPHRGVKVGVSVGL